MPQLDVTTFAPQIVWLLITFIGLYIVMAKVAIPNIAKVLEERQNRIDDNLEKAAALKKEADEAVQAYEKALAEARMKAQNEVNQVLEAAKSKTLKAEEELNAKLAEELSAAEARISEAKDKALANIVEVSSDVAKSTVEKLAGVDLDDAAVKAAVTNAMEQN